MHLRLLRPMYALAAVVVSMLHLVASEPVQYCKYGAESNEVGFCMGMLMHHNVSTLSHDLYLTMSVTRPRSTSLGWTAIGLGEVMEGALMFIVYGNPSTSQEPIISVRKSLGHKQPTLVTRQDMNGADLRVLLAHWQLPPASSPEGPATAMISLVCYSCHLWPGTQISATSKSQPWLWAWNSKQDISVFTYHAHLDMHAHHAGAGGWGNFYVDMPRSVNNWHNPPSFPPIRPGVHTLGVSESPGISVAYGLAWLKRNPVVHLHGLILGVAFLLLFPAGVVAMRSGNVKAFKYHWILQTAASGLTVVGLVLGLILRRKIDTTHQLLGVSLVAALAIQGVLGWRHHVVFLRLRRRTWLSHSHIWLGRLVMIGGWSNLLTGFVLRGYSTLNVTALGFVLGLEAVGLSAWLWWIKIKTARQEPGNKQQTERRQNDLAEYFSLGEEDDEGANLHSENSEDEESKPMMEKAEIA